MSDNCSCDCNCQEKTLWICGQLRGEWDFAKTAWDFQGVFDDMEKAVAACKTEKYFIFSASLNKELSQDPTIPEDCCYPVIEDELNQPCN